MQTAIRHSFRTFATLSVVAFLLTITLPSRRASAQADPAIQTNQQTLQDMQSAAANAGASTPASSSSTSQSLNAPPNPNTPVPDQIRSAHTIFFANDGSAPNFPYDPNTSYAAVYDALQAWGHYQLAPSVQQADLVFQLHGASRITDISGIDGNVYTSSTAAFQLTIRDPRTNTRLWTIISPVIISPKWSTAAYWQQVSVTNLVSRVKVLAGQPLSASETTQLTTYPNYHRGRTIAIFAGGFVAVGVGGGLLLHHEFENSLANQKASQDAFCKANNIPLSECAGG